MENAKITRGRTKDEIVLAVLGELHAQVLPDHVAGVDHFMFEGAHLYIQFPQTDLLVSCGGELVLGGVPPLDILGEPTPLGYAGRVWLLHHRSDDETVGSVPHEYSFIHGIAARQEQPIVVTKLHHCDLDAQTQYLVVVLTQPELGLSILVVPDDHI